MNLRYFTKSPGQTKKLGEILAKEILKTKLKKTAFIIGLEGVLGGGKTTFLQGFAKGLKVKEKILSPSFVLMKKFKIPKKYTGVTRVNFYHIDCYRVEKPKEILDLGFKEIISNPKTIVVIEWSDKIKKILPQKIIKIKFKFISKNARQLTIQSDRFNLS